MGQPTIEEEKLFSRFVQFSSKYVWLWYEENVALNVVVVTVAQLSQIFPFLKFWLFFKMDTNLMDCSVDLILPAELSRLSQNKSSGKEEMDLFSSNPSSAMNLNQLYQMPTPQQQQQQAQHSAFMGKKETLSCLRWWW